LGELAKEELRAFGGFDRACVQASCAKTEGLEICVGLGVRFGGHAQGFAGSAGADGGGAAGEGGGVGFAKCAASMGMFTSILLAISFCD